MFYNDHEPAHFHAFYNEYMLRIRLDDGSILSGQAPSRIQKYIEEWRSLHIDELKEASIKVQNHEAPGKISPALWFRKNGQRVNSG